MTIGYHDIADLPADKKRELLEKLLKEKNSQPPALPLSFAQQRLWFLDRLQPNSPVYNVPTIVRVQGKLVLPALQYALSKVVERHEVLRTVFHAADDFPTQRILEPVEVPLPLIDLETFSASEKERAARNEILKAARTPFDLSADLMLRATVVRLSEQEHLLLLVTHHIASDEWSLKILFREVAVFYSSFLHGEEPLLPPLEIQYADFALWQRETMQGKALETQLEWWRKRLSGRLPLLELPLDRPRAEGAAQGNGRLLQKQFSRELSEGVKSFSKQESVTLFMTMLAVFQALLHRYTDQEEIIVGSPIAGRTRMETEELIGFFVNTLPLRSTFAGNPTFRNLLQQVKETTLGAYAHQEVPFEKIVEALHPERSASRTPFVQVVFSLNNDFVPSELIPGLKCEWIEVDTLTAKFDLTMIVKDHPEGLDLVLEYNSDLFEAATIERLLGHYENLLTEAIRNPAVPLVQLPLLTPGERALMIENWNRTNSEYPRHDSINQLFEAQVIRTPEAIALSYGGEEWSYRELNVAANQLAQRLRRLRVAHGSLIGIYAERSPKMIVAMLAVLKSGAAYVPLDSSYPQSRLQFMIEDTGMQVIITQENLAMALPPHSASIILLDRDWHEIEQESWCLPANQATAESLAYVIYTSGSTGKPKGVAVRHRGVTRLVCNTDYVKITSADRLAQASNASFDAATFEIWGALLNGARLVGISKDTAISPTDFSRQLVEQKISILFITTALFNQLAANAPESFGHLDTVMFGGEAVDPKWVRLVLDAHPPKRLLHVYGPTENTTFSTWHLITSVDENATTIPIGRPIANSEAYILDRSLNPVPVGVAGEIYVGGDGVASGYLNREALTVERFIPHPFKPGTAERLYKTGDLARFLADGSIEFIGRIDQQVKIRGFRIELGEIESLLSRHENIEAAVVMAREDVPGEKRLVGYIVPKTQAAPQPSELRQFLKKDLPDYMVPSAFVFLKKLPLTVNEKIDRKALPAPADQGHVREKTFLPPRDLTEQNLAKVWEKVLGVQPIGVRDNFFDLGGHSLLAVKLFAQIDRVFEKKLPLAILFRAPTIEQLAAILKEEGTQHWSTIVDIQPSGSKPPIFWIHSLGGDGGGGFFYYRRLAELLGPDQPSFGIRSPQEPFDRIDLMARHYIREIKKRQPNGPYFLGGFCFGGNVAYEMATQLVEQGEKVGMLILLESSPPKTVDANAGFNANAALYSIENLYENLKDFVHQDASSQLAALKQKSQQWRKRIQNKLAPQQEKPQLKEVIDMSHYPKDYVKYAETHWEAINHFVPRPFPGQIHLFRARKQPLRSFNPTFGWEQLVEDRVHVTVIPGTHESMLQEPNVQVLANKLNQLLAQSHGLVTGSTRLAA